MRMFNFSTENCTNCYKCVRSCPVKAIRFINAKAEIDEQRCVACGQCFVVCPKKARNVENDVDIVTKMLKSEKRVYACVDSSYLGVFDNPGKFVAGLKALGFYSVEEIAVGSEIVSEKYIEYINEHNEQKYIISSDCPSTYLFIRKHHPELAKFLIPIVTPLLALGKVIKHKDEDAYNVYIGPCLSKKYETLPKTNNFMDSIITYVEIMRMFKVNFIDIERLEPMEPDVVASREKVGKSYSIAGDPDEELEVAIKKNDYDILRIKGLDNVKNLFEGMEAGEIYRSYISISACAESCITGPFIPRHSTNIFARKQNIKNFASIGWKKEAAEINWSDIDLSCSHEPTPVKKVKYQEADITGVLEAMGKLSRIDELDCGACGYNTCREKAEAVLNGMAELEMCIPYMRAKAQKVTDIIFINARNMIFIVDKNLIVKQFNPAAEKGFCMKAEEIVDKPVNWLYPDVSEFEEVFRTKSDNMNKKVEFSPYGMTVIQNLIYVPNENEIIVILQNITDEEKRRAEIEKLKLNTAEIAQNVIEKQMRVAQEIASLLGETTAETKVALNKLKDVVLKEGGL